MTKILWNETGKRFYEHGVERVVLYPFSNGVYEAGIGWDGITKINESSSAFETQAYYLDNVKYMTVATTEEFSATIEANSYPKKFNSCLGFNEVIPGLVLSQQTHKEFGLCYRTKIGNDIDGSDHGYKLHLVYNIVASPSQREVRSLSNSPEVSTFTWDVATKSFNVKNYNPVASLVLDSRKIDPNVFSNLEKILYGLSNPIIDPRLLLPLEIIVASYPLFRVGVTAIGASQIDPIN